jgi:hypothetical protein
LNYEAKALKRNCAGWYSGTPTVISNAAGAMEKLGLESRAALVRHALERGWLHAP